MTEPRGLNGRIVSRLRWVRKERQRKSRRRSSAGGGEEGGKPTRVKSNPRNAALSPNEKELSCRWRDRALQLSTFLVIAPVRRGTDSLWRASARPRVVLFTLII